MITMNMTLGEVLRVLESGGLKLLHVGARSSDTLENDIPARRRDLPWLARLEIYVAHRRDGQPHTFEGAGVDSASAINNAIETVRSMRSRADAARRARELRCLDAQREGRDPDEAWNEQQSGDAAERSGR